ncbi:Lrp/AsnC family transcriptional regulator [Actinocorallia herbida]|uniref:Lrp/AsnC family transcriptional regulator n=1 Tax=Actinocorallia herbida TaxID=58109 RepID=UPI001B86F217|nr:Lrp/AsnC family transcriptional regulator [Actinocorallia herbida]
MPPESVDEIDLALINALQVTPRADWSALGRALGVDPSTAARRWDRLHRAGLAWVTCVLGPALHGGYCMAYVEISCEPGAAEPVAVALSARAEVRYVYRLTGEHALLVVLGLLSPAELAGALEHLVEPLPGVRSVRAELRTAAYGEASRWRLRSLEPSQRQALGSPSPAAPPTPVAVDEIDRELYRLLHEDGRMTYAALADRASISEPTARRRLKRLLATGMLRPRCEVAQSVTGWPVTAVLRASAAPRDLDSAGRALATLPDVRSACALTGPRNLLLVVWLRSVEDLPRLEAQLTERAPGAVLADRAVCLRTLKQMGRLLDPDGRAVGATPPNTGPLTW